MSSSRNSAPADFAIAGSPDTRNSQPKVPNTGWPARSFFLTGLARIRSPMGLLVPLAAPSGVAESLRVHNMLRAAAVRQIDSRSEGALGEQPHALVGMAHRVGRDDHI